jgi:hypothetical protein
MPRPDRDGMRPSHDDGQHELDQIEVVSPRVEALLQRYAAIPDAWL